MTAENAPPIRHHSPSHSVNSQTAARYFCQAANLLETTSISYVVIRKFLNSTHSVSFGPCGVAASSMNSIACSYLKLSRYLSAAAGTLLT